LSFIITTLTFTQNTNFNFHKVLWTQYSYTTVWRSYSGEYTPKFVRIDRVFWKIRQKRSVNSVQSSTREYKGIQNTASSQAVKN